LRCPELLLVLVCSCPLHWSFSDDRRLIALAGSLKSLEAVATELGRKPGTVAKVARRLGVSLKSQGASKAKDK
jgi:hypothetical protein